LAGDAKHGQYGKAYAPFAKLYGDDEAVGNTFQHTTTTTTLIIINRGVYRNGATM
jgi:hypothetical protein